MSPITQAAKPIASGPKLVMSSDGSIIISTRTIGIEIIADHFKKWFHRLHLGVSRNTPLHIDL
ncbi:hypothetical protein DK37_27670 [Halomonas sp. SUBG004]|nr:hypothetical protein DK37_27670 [Halomonas sp. SUBG004]